MFVCEMCVFVNKNDFMNFLSRFPFGSEMTDFYYFMDKLFPAYTCKNLEIAAGILTDVELSNFILQHLQIKKLKKK